MVKKNILLFFLLILLILINFSFVIGASLNCSFNPIVQEPDGLRHVWCNLTNSSGAPILNANISHSTYDTNDWYKNGLMDDKGWFIGYNNIPNAYNLSDINFSIYGTKRIDSLSRAHIKYGPFSYPFPHINQTFNILLKAGSGSENLRISICNDSYSDRIYGNTPINVTRTSNYSGCMLAGTINATQQGINYNNWTWATLDITDAYNTITENQSGVMAYSIHISSYDDVSVNPVGWTISDFWMPPYHNEIKEAYVLNSSFRYTPNEEELPSGCGYSQGINMSGNVLHLRMNDNNSIIEDVSCANNNGTAYNNPVKQVSKFNMSLNFGSGSSYLQIPNSVSLNPTELTLATWIKWDIDPSQGSKWSTIINKNIDNQYRLQHSSDNHLFEFAISTNRSNRWVQSITSPVKDTWYFLVGTYDGNELKLYVNGKLESSLFHNGTLLSSNADLYIGKRNNADGRNFNGSVDEVMVFNRSLSSNEIRTHYIKGMNNFLPDERIFNISDDIELWQNGNVLTASDSVEINETTGYLFLNNNADYLEPKNLSSRQNLVNSSFTLCYFFKRTSSGEGNYRIEKWGNSMSLHVTSEDIRFTLDPVQSSAISITTGGNLVADTSWHHVCGIRDIQNQEMRIVIDGEKVASGPFNGSWSLDPFNEIVMGRDIVSSGSDEGFRGQLAWQFLHNDSHTSGDILEGINDAWWELALSEQNYEHVYSVGTLINTTTYHWHDEPVNTPISFLKIHNMNNDSAVMEYNETEKLYHYTYYTNKPELLSSQGLSGVNFTTLFEYNSTLNDTAYWYVAGASNASCSVVTDWNYPLKQGQYQLARINISVDSSTPLNKKNVYICEEGEVFPNCYKYSGGESTFHHYLKNYGNATTYCEVQNDFMSEPYIANTTIEVGCWSAYDDYNGGSQGIVLESDLHVCSGYHKMISLNGSDDAVINNPQYKIIIPNNTIFDGGDVREIGANGAWHQFIWAYDVSGCRLASNNVTFQNGEIGIFIANSTNNCTYANIHFVNMSMGFDIESLNNQELYILNNTFDGCGINNQAPIYLSTNNVKIMGNRFNSLSSGALANVESSSSSNITLEQNYYWDIGNLAVYSRGNSKTIESITGNLTCEIGEYGSQYPYSNFENFSDDYLNGASLAGEVMDYYPCTTNLESNEEEIKDEQIVSSGGYAPKIYFSDVNLSSTGNNFNLRYNDKIRFVINSANHTLTMQNFNSTSAKVKIESELIITWIEKGDLYEFDLNNDSVKDVRVRYDGINSTTRRARIFIQEVVLESKKDLISGEVVADLNEEKHFNWLKFSLILFAIFIISFFLIKFFYSKSKKR
jgi:hypothetical protein